MSIENVTYYDLFNKYKSDYQIEDILSGQQPDSIVIRAKNAKFDERLALLGLLLDGINSELKDVCAYEDMLRELMTQLKNVKSGLSHSSNNVEPLLSKCITDLKAKLTNGIRASSISDDARITLQRTTAVLEDESALVNKEDFISSEDAFKMVKEDFDNRTKMLKYRADNTGKRLSNLFAFCENAFGDGQELLILVTELTIGKNSSRFISRYGCKEYFEHNKELLFYERRIKLISELGNLDLD